MGSTTRLNDVTFDSGGELDAEFVRWREAIERANTWDVYGSDAFDAGPTGYSLFIKGYAGPITAVVATGGITARVSATVLGQGNVVLWLRKAGTPNLAAGRTVKVYSGFSTAIPAGEFVEVAPEGDAYKLVGSDYCAP